MGGNDARGMLAGTLLEVTATLATQLVRPGLHRVARRLGLRLALDQRLDLVLGFRW